MRRGIAFGALLALSAGLFLWWLSWWRAADEKFVRSHFAVPKGIQLTRLEGAFRPPPAACSFVWSRRVQATFELTPQQREAWTRWREEWTAQVAANGLEPEPCSAAEPVGALCLQASFTDQCLSGKRLERSIATWSLVLEPGTRQLRVGVR